MTAVPVHRCKNDQPHDAHLWPGGQCLGLEHVNDQPLPTINDEVCVQDEVIKYIDRRKAIGVERYGTVLQPHNGRDSLRDAFEEAVDLVQYLAQAIIERDGSLP